MEREDCSGHPCPRHCQTPKHAPEQKRIAGMQHHVDDVVPRRPQLPELILYPERCKCQWIVLRVDLRVKPDLLETRQCVEKDIFLHIEFIIPNELTVHRW